MRILTKDEVDEDLCFRKLLRFVDYKDEEDGFLGAFPTSFESRDEAAIDGDAILVYTVEYKGRYYYKFVSPMRPDIGPMYVALEIQNDTHACFGNELRNMHTFKHEYVLKFDKLFHDVTDVAISPDDILKNEGYPGAN